MHQSMGAPSVVAAFWEGPACHGRGRPPFVSPLPLARADRGALFLRAGSASPAGSDVGRVFYTHPQAMTAEGAGVLRRMGASARRSGAREYRLSHKSPLALVAGAEKCPATLRNPACVRPVHGMANKVEVLGLAARRRGLSIHSSPARRTSGLVGSHGSAGNSRPSLICATSRASNCSTCSCAHRAPSHYRDQLQRLISAASRDGVILFVGPEQVAQAVRRPEAAA